jgi:hypothetical protein
MWIESLEAYLHPIRLLVSVTSLERNRSETANYFDDLCTGHTIIVVKEKPFLTAEPLGNCVRNASSSLNFRYNS